MDEFFDPDGYDVILAAILVPVAVVDSSKAFLMSSSRERDLFDQNDAIRKNCKGNYQTFVKYFRPDRSWSDKRKDTFTWVVRFLSETSRWTIWRVVAT